jgi:hypothetical protein
LGVAVPANWIFAPSGGGETVGFNDAGINTFKASRIRSVAREVTQNSLDASVQKPVKLRVEPFTLSKTQAPEFFTLLTHIHACASIAPEGEPKKFFAQAKELLESENVSGLLFHDTNTSGLTGEIGGSGPWQALTRSAGVTQKASGKLGSFGHGARAPFALSGIRTVLYLTQIIVNGKVERRAVGRSILMSHQVGGKMSQGVGFFGNGDEATPFVDQEIPSWLDNLRPKELGEGTTLVVFHVKGGAFREKFEYEIIRSYALAIEAGNLEVDVLGDAIEASGLEDLWNETVTAVENSVGQENEVESVDIENLKTIFSPHQRHTIETALGKCEIRLRSGDDVRSRSVAIARGGGMLITSKPERLKLFTGLENFSCVVWVSEPVGSSELAQLENPAHNEFSKDWLSPNENDSDPDTTWTKYLDFTSAVREKLKELFALSSSDTYEVKILDSLLDGVGRDRPEGLGSTRTVKVIERPSRVGKTGEEGARMPGPGRPANGEGRRKPKGPRVIPTSTGGKVATGGWKPKEGFATCRFKAIDGDRLRLQVDVPKPLAVDTGVVFVATSSSGEVVALHGEVEVLLAGRLTHIIELQQPELQYSVDVFLFERSPAVGDGK